MKYKANKQGLRELLYSEGVREIVHEKAEMVANRAGEGYEAGYAEGKSRYRAIVSPQTWSARMRDKKTNNLLRALG